MRAIIVDDEHHARMALRGVLEENFTFVEIVDECKNIPEAVVSINKHNPDVVFLDISMPGQSGLELFDFFDDNLSFNVIFVTAYSEYALNAFEKSATDYLLKPVRISAIERALNKIRNTNGGNIEKLRQQFNLSADKKVVLNSWDGLVFLKLSEIIYLKADGAYTHFFTTDKRKISVSKGISEFEKLQDMGTFIRIHRSHIINYQQIKKIVKQDGGMVIMNNDDVLSIASKSRQTLMELFEKDIL
jgi:two-component system LytT family response regulator